MIVQPARLGWVMTARLNVLVKVWFVGAAVLKLNVFGETNVDVVVAS